MRIIIFYIIFHIGFCTSISLESEKKTVLDHERNLTAILISTGYYDNKKSVQNIKMPLLGSITTEEDKNLNVNELSCGNESDIEESQRLSYESIQKIKLYVSILDNTAKYHVSKKSEEIIHDKYKLIKNLNKIIDEAHNTAFTWKSGGGLYYQLKKTFNSAEKFQALYGRKISKVFNYVEINNEKFYKRLEKLAGSNISTKTLNQIKKISVKREFVLNFLKSLQNDALGIKLNCNQTGFELLKFERNMIYDFENFEEIRRKIIHEKPILAKDVEEKENRITDILKSLKIELKSNLTEFEMFQKEKYDNQIREIDNMFAKNLAISMFMMFGFPAVINVGTKALKKIPKISKAGTQLHNFDDFYEFNKIAQLGEDASKSRKFFAKAKARVATKITVLASKYVDTKVKIYLIGKLVFESIINGKMIYGMVAGILKSLSIAKLGKEVEQIHRELHKVELLTREQLEIERLLLNMKAIENNYDEAINDINDLIVSINGAINGVQMVGSVFSRIADRLSSFINYANNIESAAEKDIYLKYAIEELQSCWSNIYVMFKPYESYGKSNS